MSIAKNYQSILHNVKLASSVTCCGNENPLQTVKVVAVTKNHSVQAMQQAMQAGVASVGENRVQEAQIKYHTVGREVEWHLIGHLQTNKAKQAVSIFDLIHSVESEKLAIEIDRAAQKLNKRQDVLIQVNIADEETKFGIDPGELIYLAQFINGLEYVRLCGIMTIAPYYDDVEDTRPIFKEAFQLFKELQTIALPNTNIQWLSMGMTNDYHIAIEEGSNLIRVGTGIFGARQY